MCTRVNTEISNVNYNFMLLNVVNTEISNMKYNFMLLNVEERGQDQ